MVRHAHHERDEQRRRLLRLPLPDRVPEPLPDTRVGVLRYSGLRRAYLAADDKIIVHDLQLQRMRHELSQVLSDRAQSFGVILNFVLEFYLHRPINLR